MIEKAGDTTPSGLLTPLWRYRPNEDWEVVAHSLASPAADGSVSYFVDVLSPQQIRDAEDSPLMFSEAVARAACRWLLGIATARGLEVSDGPYLQVLDDDGTVPRGWVVLRALLWADEFDYVVPVDERAASGTGVVWS